MSPLMSGMFGLFEGVSADGMFGTACLCSSALCVAYNISLTAFRFSTFEVFDTRDTLSTLLLMGVSSYSIYWLGNGADLKLSDNRPIQGLVLGLQLLIIYMDRGKHVAGRRYKDRDLSGKVYIVTGANTGIGFETTKALVAMGATVVMACRSPGRAKDARALLLQTRVTDVTGGVTDVTGSVTGVIAASKLIVLPLDLCDFASVRAFADSFTALRLPLHGLINNAGLMMSERSVTAAGLETVFTANHLSHFLLTNLLLPHLQKSKGRVVTLSSSIHRLASRFDFDDVMSEQGFELFRNYAQSKLANILFTKELSRRMVAQNTGVLALAVHPGCVRTEVTRHMSPIMQFLNNLFSPLLQSMQKTPQQGAYSSVYAATQPNLGERKTDIPGGLLFHCRFVPVSAAARDAQAAGRLWALSEKLTGSAK